MFELVSTIQKNPTFASPLHPALIVLILVGAVALSILLGNFIAKYLRSEVHGWRLGTIFAVVSVASLIIGFGWPPKFGVDLRGGYTIIGQLRDDPERNEPVDIATMIPQLMARVDPSGVREILIRALGKDKIEVVIPEVDMDEALRIWDLFTQAGELRFRIVADRNYHPALTTRANDLIQRGINDKIVREKVEPPTDNKSGKIIGRWYELGRERTEGTGGGLQPFKFMPNLSHLVRNGKTKQIIDVQPFGGDPIEFSNWAAEQKINRVEILNVEPESADNIMNVEGQHVFKAWSGVDEKARPAVHFSMTRDGRRRMHALTSRNKTDGVKSPLLAIISDGNLVSAPTINSAISDSGIIEGRFTQKEVDDVVRNLDAGKLEATLSENPISQDFQQSNIGEELKRLGILACAVSLIIVTIFMMFYYRFGGFIASVVLLLNVVLVLAIVMIIKQPLTLTGLAGIVLTIGMSVDANVLIYERIREELKKGAALRMAIRNGYDRALTTIVDANLTTMLTAVVLYVIGTEQLKGFAVTLILGILTSMFTAIFCSRVVLELAERRKWITSLKMMNAWTSGRVIDFVGQRRIWYAVSLAVIAIGLVAAFFRGSEIFEHDLRGGSTARIVLNPDSKLNVDQVRAMLDKYDEKISDRESAQFTVAAIDSKEFPNRVFKVDSNIPIWEGDDRPTYKQLKEAIVEIFDDKLMQLRVDYDPAKLEVTRVDVQPAPTGVSPATGQIPTGQNSPIATPEKTSSRAVRLPWAAAIAAISNPLGNIIVQDGQPAAQETKDAAPTSEPAVETPAANPPAQEPIPPTETPVLETPPSAAPVTQEPPSISSVQRFVARTELKFAQPISRGSLVDAIVTAANKTNQVVLDPEDVQVSVSGQDPEDLSVKSDVWDVTMNIGQEGEAKTILDSLQTQYNGQPYLPTLSGVGGQIAAQTQWRALAAIVASLFGIIIYVWVRFQNVAFGIGAVVALIHDVLVTLGAIAVSFWLAPFLGFAQIENFRISLAVIAAFLTLIGYSINDTIVIYDRIREVRGKRPELTAEMINISLSQTLSRTIITSLVTLLAVLVLYFLGGDSIHPFAFALVVGIIAGSYSSLFIAAPITLWLVSRSMAAKAAAKAKS